MVGHQEQTVFSNYSVNNVTLTALSPHSHAPHIMTSFENNYHLKIHHFFFPLYT